MIKTFSANGSASDSAIENVIQQTLKANKYRNSRSFSSRHLAFLEEAQKSWGCANRIGN